MCLLRLHFLTKLPAIFLAAMLASLLSMTGGCNRSSHGGVSSDVPRGGPGDYPAGGQPPSGSGPLPTGRGTVRGFVRYVGPLPEQVTIDTSADPNCHRSSPLHDESIVINPNGTMKNVLVYIKQRPIEPRDGASTHPAADQLVPPLIPVLDQIGCQYVPHVVGVQAGHPLIVRSEDATVHNVMGQPSVNPAFNLAFHGPGQQQVIFHYPEIFAVRCDVHPWMRAWIGVFNHPYFAVTGADGSYKLSGVPDGHYTLVGWQERFGAIEVPITVEPDGTVAQDFKFQAPE